VKKAYQSKRKGFLGNDNCGNRQSADRSTVSDVALGIELPVAADGADAAAGLFGGIETGLRSQFEEIRNPRETNFERLGGHDAGAQRIES